MIKLEYIMTKSTKSASLMDKIDEIMKEFETDYIILSMSIFNIIDVFCFPEHIDGGILNPNLVSLGYINGSEAYVDLEMTPGFISLDWSKDNIRDRKIDNILDQGNKKIEKVTIDFSDWI